VPCAVRLSSKHEPEKGASAQISHHENRKLNTTKQDAEFNKYTTDPRRSPSFLAHLIGTKNCFLTHFYTSNVKMELRSGKEPQPSRVLYIGPSKRLK
jgi:hypothetical protein